MLMAAVGRALLIGGALLLLVACGQGSDQGPARPVDPADRPRLAAELEGAFAEYRQRLPEQQGSTTIEAIDVNGTDVTYRARIDSDARQDVIDMMGGMIRFGLCNDRQIAGWVERGATFTYEFRGTGSSTANMRIANCG